MKFSARVLIFLFSSLFIISCNSGGGDDAGPGSSGAAEVSVTTSPKTIDVQDRTMTRIRLADVNRNGIVVKIRFPSKLEYVSGTSYLKVEEEDRDVNPDVSVQDGSKRYLVFFFPRSYFGDVPDSEDEDEGSETGELRLELVGRERLSSGTIEVDVDVDDPTIPNSSEFTLDNTAFQAESDASIEVVD